MSGDNTVHHIEMVAIAFGFVSSVPESPV
jgi:hypothetical protein